MIKHISIWAAERLLEMLLAAGLLIVVYGKTSHPNFSGAWGQLYAALVAVWAFYFMTGYILSTILFGIANRTTRIIDQTILMVAAFLSHFTLLVLLSGGGVERPLLLASCGSCVVTIVTLLGSLSYGRYK